MPIDTHCHLLDAAFDADRDAVIERARAAGVTHAVVMGENEAENHRVLAAARLEPFLLPAAGHYPSHLDLEMAARTEAFIRAHRDELVAVGEVGVDHRITEDPADHAVQDEILRRLAGVAAELDLPISVHSRSAGRHAIEVIRSTAATRVVMHAFDGKYGSAVSGLDAGYHFSVPPSVVRSRQKQKLVTQLPLDRLLLESDAPVLGPDPAARNEPANLRHAAETIAALKRIPLEQVLEAVRENTHRVFPRVPGPDPHSPSEAR
jgi:TatD DNase family protein